MGCSQSKNTIEINQSTNEESDNPHLIHKAKSKVLTKKPCFGKYFSEEEIYESDQELLSSEEIKLSVKKWNDMSQGHDKAEALQHFFKENPAEFFNALKNGPPPEYRWLAWKTALRIDQVWSKGVYESLISSDSKKSCKYLENIQIDAKTTFDYYFNPQQSDYQSSMISKLENLLTAIAIHCADIGYRSGINLIACFLLMVSDLNEEEAFWAFIAIVKDNLTQDPLNLCGASDIYIDSSEKADTIRMSFAKLLDKELPNLKSHFKAINIKDLAWIDRWLWDIFLSSFSFKYCLRFWDYVLSYGFSGIFKLSLAVLVCSKEKLIGNDHMECLAILNSFSDGENLPNPKVIIETADKVVLDPNIIGLLANLMKDSGYGPKLTKRVTYEVNKETGLMAGIEDEPKVGNIEFIESLNTASRSKLI